MAYDEDDKLLNKQRVSFYNFFILISLGIGSWGFGFAGAISSSTIGQTSFIKYFELDTRSNGTALLSSMNGHYYAGAVLGSLVMPTFADRWGRKWACATACIIIVLSGALLAGSVNVGMFIAFRFVLGFGSFMLLSAIPTMMAEIVPARLRGGLVYIHGCMVCLGYTTANWVGFGFFHWRSGALNTWRPPVAITCFLPLVLLIGLPFMPESPRWLCMQDRQDEAEAILLRLHADPNDPTDGLARVEFYQIQQQVRIDRTLGSSWMHILKTPSYRKRALLAFGTNAIIQCSGVLVINSYSTILYASLGYDPSKQLLLLALWTSVSLGLTIIGALVIDKFPRNKFMAIGMMGCISTLIVEAALVAQFVPSNNGTALRAAVAMFFVFQFFDCIFVEGTPFVFIAEIFPTHLRAKGMSIGTASLALVNVMWVQAAPTAFKNIGWKFYLVFIITGALGAAVFWFLYPDTRGLPLEEIAAVFGDEAEVAIYQRELELDDDTHMIVDHHGQSSTNHAVEVAHHEKGTAV